MASTSGRRKQLLVHLDAALAEIERLSILFADGIAALEASTFRDLSVAAAADWFRMYLRLVDLGIELRRGEFRHRTTRPIRFPCMHATGARGAQHSGLSIDDTNALYQHLERMPGVKESQLEALFMRMDALDRDGVGPLDERLAACLVRFVRLPSAFYSRVDVSGSDPHQELVIQATPPTKVTRTCFSINSCRCVPDAMPWIDFRLAPGDDVDDAFAQSAISAVATHALDSEEMGIAELKRQYGFDHHQDEDDDDEDENLHVKRRRVNAPVVMPLGRPPQPPRDIYRRKCQERGLARKRKIEELLVVKSGALELDLSHFGFHAPQDLQDLVDVVIEAQVPVRLVDVTNNFFDARSFEIFCDLLRLPLVRAQLRTLQLRCMALPQRPDFAALLRILMDTESGELAELTTLDLSYNTFFEDAVLSLNDLLNGLKRLKTLSLESCFPKAPDPGVVEVAVVKDLVRQALVACSGRLRRLNFGSNWMSFPLLNSLFSADSALEELTIAQMTFFYFEPVDAMPISWKFSFQRQQRITLSETRHSRGEYVPFFVDALTYCLKMRMAQLHHLDLWFLPPHERKSDEGLPDFHLHDRVVSLLQAFAEYGALRTVRLRYDLGGGNPQDTKTRLVLAQLFRDGLEHCESLDLALRVPLSLIDLRDLLSRLRAPQLRTLKLSIRLLASDPTADGGIDFGRVFRAAIASLSELTLDFQVELQQSKSLLPDHVVVEMESAWRSLGATRQVSLVKRKTKKDGSSKRDMVTFAFLFTSSSSS